MIGDTFINHLCGSQSRGCRNVRVRLPGDQASDHESCAGERVKERMMITAQMVLYIGGYAPANQPGIHACTFDDATGELTVRDSFAGIVNPSYLLVHPNGRWLYAVSETSQQKEGTPGAVWALQCAREPWSMEPINHQPTGGDFACHR